MEPFNKRLHRFLTSDVHEIPATLLNSISNFFLPELRSAKAAKADRLLFLGTHAVIQTVCEQIFAKRGAEATRFYLEHFVDRATPDGKFSAVAADIHEMRNTYAHQWLSRSLHEVAINYTMAEGWKVVGDDLHINPDVYADQFLAGFGAGGPIWDYDKLVTDDELRVRRYTFLVRWLKLPKKHPIAVSAMAFAKTTDSGDRARQEEALRELIFKEYGLL